MECQQSFKYRIDPTPAQQRLLWSAIGGSRFAYNHLLGLVKNKWATIRVEKQASEDGETHSTEYLSTNHFGLLYLWVGVRDEVAPWWVENASQEYNDAALRLSKAFTNWKKGRAGFPRFKKRH